MNTTKPARDYFDRPCESHEEFEQMKTQLEREGFRYIGNMENCTMHLIPPLTSCQARVDIGFSFYSFFVSEEVRKQFLEYKRNRSGIDRKIEQNRNEQFWERLGFVNKIEYLTWDYKRGGYEVVRTQGFAVDGKCLDDYVAFFIKPIAEK